MVVEISVIVTTYNVEWTKLKATLLSILLQEDISYEIIIADDCSKCDLSDYIEELFKSYNFSNYTLLSNTENLGIVKNFLNGLRVAKADYIRGLGNGDLLFDRDSLRKMLDYMKSKNADVCLGNLVAYYKDELNIVVRQIRRYPQNIKVYNNPNKLMIHYLLYGDRGTGACSMYKKKTIINYLNQILGKVIYAEDMVLRLMVFDRVPICYCDDNLLWYEIGNGITTSENRSEWFAKLDKDWDMATEILINACKKQANNNFTRKYIKRIIAHQRFRHDMTRINHIRYYLSYIGILLFRIKCSLFLNKTELVKDTSFVKKCYCLLEKYCQDD